MKTWKVALVGAGTIAKDHYMPQIQAMENAELVGVMDIVPEAVTYAQKQFNIPKGFTCLDKMLDEVEFDILADIAAIPAHYGINLKALQAGKHIYTQKPMALTVDQATELIETAKANNVKISASPIHMLRPTVQATRDYVKAGLIGKVHFVTMRSSHGGPEYYQTSRLTDASWFYQPDAGPIYDLGVHGLHQLTGILGPAKRVTCFSGISEPMRMALGCCGDFERVPFAVNTPDTVLMLLDFGNSTFAFLDCTFCVKASKGPGTQIFGNRGAIAVERGAEASFFRGHPDDGERGWYPLEMPEEPAYQSIGVKDLIDALEEGRAPVLSAEQARHVIEIMVKAPISAKEGCAMELETTF